MANFCTKCGKPIADCVCASRQPGPSQPMVNRPVSIDMNSAKVFLENTKNRMGIGDEELNKGDAFETNKLIVPNCVRANEGEIPVKQYEVATLRSRILGIPYTKAVGRLQVTNKRVIFRAPGRCWAGRTTLQHEFAIDELAGVESRREYVFTFVDLLIGFFVASIGVGIIMLLLGLLGLDSYGSDNGGLVFLSFLLSIAGCVPFFVIKKKWLLKLLCLGGAAMAGFAITMASDEEFLFYLGIVITFVISVFTLIALLIHSIRPNLVLIVKTKSASSEAINIKRKKKAVPFLGGKEEENTGYTEVYPAKDAERSIRELLAVINDIQKLGDFGIEKWKAK